MKPLLSVLEIIGLLCIAWAVYLLSPIAGLVALGVALILIANFSFR